MIALQIESTREFLNLLLEGNEYDSFQVGNCEVTTIVTFATDGRRQVTEEDEEEHSDRVHWSELKATVIEMIRTSPVSGSLKLDLFRYMSRDMGSIRIDFRDGKFTLTTGYMQKEFSLDKRGSEDWDDVCMQQLSRNAISMTVL